MSPVSYRARSVAIGNYLCHHPGMSPRSRIEVGDAVRARRDLLGLTQDDVPGVSSSTVRKIENGTADSFRRKSIVGYMRALGWPPDAFERLEAGEDPSTLAEPAPVVDVRTPVEDALLADDGISDDSRDLLLSAYRTARRRGPGR